MNKRSYQIVCGDLAGLDRVLNWLELNPHERKTLNTPIESLYRDRQRLQVRKWKLEQGG